MNEIEQLKKELAESKAETAACLAFLGCEMEWEYFRADMLYADDPRAKSASTKNAERLRVYLHDSGHGAKFLLAHQGCLTKNEKILLRHVIDYARQRMITARCNDTDAEWLQHFTDAELTAIHARIAAWTVDDPQRYSREHPAGDLTYADYIRERLFSEGE